jgi:DNA-binding winged helix-turn-helix (wHTH) protein
LDSAFQIGEWTVEPQLNDIANTDRTIHIEPKAMQVLRYLAEHADEVVTKERLMRVAWADTFCERRCADADDLGFEESAQ